MRKYYLLEWPESQEWADNEEAIFADDNYPLSVFIPCDIYDRATDYKS